MQSGNKKIKGILEKYKDVFEALENYDKTRTLPFQRKRIDITLSVRAINKLKELKEKTGKPISQIIEERIEKRDETQPKTHFKPKKIPKQIPPSEPPAGSDTSSIPSYIR